MNLNRVINKLFHLVWTHELSASYKPDTLPLLRLLSEYEEYLKSAYILFNSKIYFVKLFRGD